MLLHFSLLLLALGTDLVRADLTCMTWTGLSSVVGLVCHFAPRTYEREERAKVVALQRAALAFQKVVPINLRRVPVTVQYDKFSAAAPDGTTTGATPSPGANIHDLKDVTLVFSRGMGNHRVKVYEFPDWVEVASCLLVTASRLARPQGATASTPNRPDYSEVSRMASECISIRQYKMLTFDVTSKNA